MLDWIFEGIANWIASVITSIMDAVSGIFLNALGTDMTAMEEYFPFVTSAFNIMQYMAWALLFIITIWQLFRTFGGPLTESESPWQLLARSTMFAFLIGYAKPIFSIALDIARTPYTALMDASLNPGDFTFSGISSVLGSSIVTLVSAISVVGLLLQIILLIALGWNYFKMLLEVVERYIIVGVLCYTSPLAFCMGGSKATNKVFQSWCRMIGSQLLLLVLNVWFLRGFNSSVGQFVANGGALTSGHGNIFLWLFCALAFLKTAQKFDGYLASLGLTVAQTGSGMGMELMMGLRMLSGFAGGGPKSAGKMFAGGAASAAGGAAGSAAGAGGGFMAGLASKFKGNSYVRDAVVDGGGRMGAHGGIGFVGRAFGGMAARNGAELTGASISSVAARPAAVSGSIAGDIADRSIKNYMPHLSGKASPAGEGVGDNGTQMPVNPALSGVKYGSTQITGGHISTTATTADGKTASVDLFSAAQYDRPNTPHTVASASDGSQWYQIASGEGMGAFYPTPQFTGDASEAAQMAAAFPSAPEGTTLRTVGDGVLEASHPDGGNSMWYSGAHFQEPDAPHDSIQDSNGASWYAMQPHATQPHFEPASGGLGGDSGTDGGVSDGAAHYNRAQFQQFMPGYEQQVSQIDTSRHGDGQLEVRHADGSGTAFYDKTMYQSPRGDYQVYEDNRGGQWYAINGTPSVERKPVYENSKPVYDGDNLRTVNVESLKYRTTPVKFEDPKARDVNDRKPPNQKRK
ncbi:MAG: hypothetical protein LBN00_10540 [Oscillospiraceae bacterium]|jgi:hypothetical protein|nr:hypothetical protein [Oscillospiraceae bacterium]